jgi:hypothetical protein
MNNVHSYQKFCKKECANQRNLSFVYPISGFSVSSLLSFPTSPFVLYRLQLSLSSFFSLCTFPNSSPCFPVIYVPTFHVPLFHFCLLTPALPSSPHSLFLCSHFFLSWPYYSILSIPLTPRPSLSLFLCSLPSFIFLLSFSVASVPLYFFSLKLSWASFLIGFFYI